MRLYPIIRRPTNKPTIPSLGVLLLVDGFHRLEAMRQLGRRHVDVVVYKGTFNDAVILACELNANRGLCYSQMETTQVAKAYLKACWGRGQHPSDTEVAHKLGCSRERVERARASLAKQDDPSPIPPVKSDRKII